MEKKLEKRLAILTKQISNQYDLIDMNNELMVDRFHDILMYQKDGALLDEDEALYYLEVEDDIEAVESIIVNLEDCLKYCKGVIKIQNQLDKLGSSVYG